MLLISESNLTTLPTRWPFLNYRFIKSILKNESVNIQNISYNKDPHPPEHSLCLSEVACSLSTNGFHCKLSCQLTLPIRNNLRAYHFWLQNWKGKSDEYYVEYVFILNTQKRAISFSLLYYHSIGKNVPNIADSKEFNFNTQYTLMILINTKSFLCTNPSL